MRDLEAFNLPNRLERQRKLLVEFKNAIFTNAIRGKISERWREKNPGVEAASHICNRKQAQKMNDPNKDGCSPKKNNLSLITKEEIPFEIPGSWEWCRLGDVIRLISGTKFRSVDFEKGNGVKCIKITNAGVWGIYKNR